MHDNTLLRFNQALSWNAAHYLAYKCSFVMRTVLLYRCMSSDDFSTWGILNSTLFLFLLWIDGGFRKSIPRFALYVPSRIFFRILIPIQSFLLIVSLPLFLITLFWIKPFPLTLFIIAGATYISEGLHALMRHIFHGYFLNKSFNTLSIQITTGEMFSTFSCITLLQSVYLLQTVLLIKFFFTTLLVMLSIYRLRNHESSEHINTGKFAIKPFITHTIIMWFTAILKSLTERNFLMPLITKSIGTIEGNMFKVANDASLLFYRVIIKTIGSADTVLLATIHANDGEQSMMRDVTKKVTTQITRACIPLLGIVVFLMIFPNFITTDQYVFQLFLIMVIGYLAEATLLMYERILEVYINYRYIIIAYIPYGIAIMFLYKNSTLASIGLSNIIILVQGVRLVNAGVMRLLVYYGYKI